MEHHEQALARYVARESERADTIAVIVSGSLSRGTERAESDIDLYLLVAEDRWAAALRQQRVMYVEREGADYEGGYFDVKLATLSYLDDAAERGDDPVRSSFAQARIAFSRIGDLGERIARVATVPEGQWRSRLASHLAQARLHGGYFIKQGIQRDDPVLSHHAAVHLATSAARAVLALNRTMFPGTKELLSTLEAVSDKPVGMVTAIEELLRAPSIQGADRVLELLEPAAGWSLEPEHTLSTFVLDNELAWRYRESPPEYR
ncbi:MAG TPA: hypothetical protein VN133_12945 [Humibacter sp.]|nr:hypothetical protein [Humibacter sp.]